jgi:hypothetical protein
MRRPPVRGRPAVAEASHAVFLRENAWDRQICQQTDNCALFIPLISQHSQERLEE